MYGHVLDLVFTHGLLTEDLELYYHDQKPILFNIPVLCCSVYPVESLQCLRSFSSTTGTEFVTGFTVLQDMDVDEDLHW